MSRHKLPIKTSLLVRLNKIRIINQFGGQLLEIYCSFIKYINIFASQFSLIPLTSTINKSVRVKSKIKMEFLIEIFLENINNFFNILGIRMVCDAREKKFLTCREKV